MTADEAVASVAAGQLGLFTTRQARSCGFSPSQLARLAARGRVVAVRRGVYQIAGTPASAEQPLLAAILAAGPKVVASHRSAAALWDLKGYLRRGVQLTTWGGRPPTLAGVVMQRARNGVPAWQRKVRYGIPVTSAARTLVDLASTTEAAAPPSSQHKLEKAWDDAQRRNLLTDDEVAACVQQVGRRRVSKAFLELLEHRVAPCDGDLAKDVLKLILAAGIVHPVLEHEVAPDHEDKVFHLDMAWPAGMIAVEVEGWEAHRQRGPFDHGAGRAAILAAAGWTILPVTSRTKADLPRRLRRALATRTMKAS